MRLLFRPLENPPLTHRRFSLKEIFDVSDLECPAVLDKAAESILVTDEEGKIIFANSVAKKKLSEKKGSLVGQNIRSNLRFLSDKSEIPGAKNPIRQALDKNEEVSFTDGLFWKGKEVKLPVQCTAKHLANEKGKVIGHVFTLTDRTDQRELEKNLEYQRNYDELTGLINHRRFRTELKDALNNATEEGAVVLFDVDRFKEVNDSFGTEVGDEILASLAELLGRELPESATLARFGGDEFIVLLPEENKSSTEELVASLLEAVRNYRQHTEGTSVQATLSAGFVTFPEQGNTTKELLARADIALTQAKQSGRNQYKAYKSGHESRKAIQSRVDWVRQIEDAIREDNFVLYAQPILELGTDKVSHYEILIRMSENGKNLVSPGSFLPVAEKFGLSRDIDKWVIRQTLKQLPEEGKRELDHQYAINLSGQSMTDDELLTWLKENRKLREGNFEQLLFEVTETAAVHNIELANNFISTLKERGSKFALDDFGMGFSSFNYLKELSVDYLKIDGSFIQDLPSDSMNQNLVQSIVEVAHRLHKETIAEFVEDEETLRLVKDYGSDHAQGYHIGRPEPLSGLV